MTDSVDPLAPLARATAKAASWAARQLGRVVESGKIDVDFANAGFIRQYAVVFAASAFLTLVLWLLAVAKRAVRGVPFTTAFAEAIGFLWLAVAASAFTPLILYTVVGATNEVTDGLVAATGQHAGLFANLGAELTAGHVGGGPLMLLLVSLVTILLCGALWLLLVLRALGLYVGALLGVVVYAGLVDRDLWRHVRRWTGVMIALVLVEPAVVIVLGLAAALETSADHGAVVAGLAVTTIALVVAIYIIWRVPGMGDAVKVARLTVRTVGGPARAAVGSATTGVQSGIQAHSGRIEAGKGSHGQINGSSVRGGISAHGQRKPKPKPKRD